MYKLSSVQGWEFAHLISERIAHFLSKNERFTHSLIFRELPERFAHDRSFLVSYLSDSLTIAHFLSATWGNRSFDLSEMRDSLTSLTKTEEMSENEQFAHFVNKIFFFIVRKTY